MALSKKSVEELARTFKGDPNGGLMTITGYDEHGKPVTEVIDTRLSLSERLGRDVAVSLVSVKRP